jgi:response regulator NasT
MSPSHSLRLVIIAPGLLEGIATDSHARAQAERSRQLRIGLLGNGYSPAH